VFDELALGQDSLSIADRGETLAGDVVYGQAVYDGLGPYLLDRAGEGESWDRAAVLPGGFAPASFLEKAGGGALAAAVPRGGAGTPGKGDDTLEELSRATSVAVDQGLAGGKAVWGSARVASEQGGGRLGGGGGGGGGGPRELLMKGGAKEDEIDWYGCFEEEADEWGELGEVPVLVVGAGRLGEDADLARGYEKVVVVGSEEANVTTPDRIYVGSLGELRALTICSYAALNKKC
jgi:hypothetical protein